MFFLILEGTLFQIMTSLNLIERCFIKYVSASPINCETCHLAVFCLIYVIVLHCFVFCNCKQVLSANRLFQLALRTVLCSYVTLGVHWHVSQVLFAFSFKFVVVEQTARVLSLYSENFIWNNFYFAGKI